MTDKQTRSHVQTVSQPLSSSDNTIWGRLKNRLQWNNKLSWVQWLILFSFGLIVILIEIRNHNRMWQMHQVDSTILTDNDLLWEIVLFGFALPLLAGFLIDYASRVTVEKNRIAREVEMRQELASRIQTTQSWNELTELIVKTTGNAVSADRAWLLSQRSKEDEFRPIAFWERPSNGELLPFLNVAPSICEQCYKQSEAQLKTIACPHVSEGDGQANHIRYCRWLSSEDIGKSALLIDVPVNRPLSFSQMGLLEDLNNEMTLALINANLQYDKQQSLHRVMNERIRIARNLHDTLGQNISFLRLKLEQLNEQLPQNSVGAWQDDLTSMIKAADEAYEQVRDTLEELRTTTHQDLETAIQQYAIQVEERSKINISVHIEGRPHELSARRSRQIMYILREALNNVEKHAHAHKVDINLQWLEDAFNLTIVDDGVGFQPATELVEGHYGMMIMTERARAIQAKLLVDSSLGGGTTLTLSVPLLIVSDVVKSL